MPLLEKSSYRPPFGFYSGHLQTVYPTIFRKLSLCTTERERIPTPDGDFIDLDWARAKPSRRLAILTHGLEGSSRSKYVQGMARALVLAGWHVLAWNFRSCSGEPNLKLHSYHSGSINDLETVIHHADTPQKYESIALIGFSLGGNVTLKLVGDLGHFINPRIRAAVGISVPCDLASSAKRLEHYTNRIYMRRFLKTLSAKVREKIARFPDEIHDVGLDQMRTFREFDEAYTAPLHGFINAADYWRQCSCKNRLQNITTPTLLMNALDDPFLTPSCYPIEIAQQHPHFYLEMPKHGGHMGFIQFNGDRGYWAETRTVEFLDNVITEELPPRVCG
jgi:predicted alpha/beta-fold hydrolase